MGSKFLQNPEVVFVDGIDLLEQGKFFGWVRTRLGFHQVDQWVILNQSFGRFEVFSGACRNACELNVLEHMRNESMPA